MDMKAMMFAGGGLFLSMVATTVWISGDVSRMRAEERANQAQRCAMAQQANDPPAQNAAGATPAGDFATPATPADSSCATTDTAAPINDGGTTGLDPVTGQPLAQAGDGFSADPSMDPATGQVVQPTSASIDPAAAPTLDPVTGQPLPGAGDPTISSGADPFAGQDAGGVPTGNVAEAGF